MLPGAWLLGGLFGLTASATTGGALPSALWFLLLGGLLVADAKLSLRVTIALAALLGLYHGYLNGTGMGASGTVAVALLGLISAVFVLVALIAAFVVLLTRPVDSNRRTRGGKLDRCQRFAVIGLGHTKRLRLTLRSILIRLDDYQVSFKCTGKLIKLMLTIDRPKLSPADEKLPRLCRISISISSSNDRAQGTYLRIIILGPTVRGDLCVGR